MMLEKKYASEIMTLLALRYPEVNKSLGREPSLAGREVVMSVCRAGCGCGCFFV